MPFAPGEKINYRFEGDAAKARYRFEGETFTVANGGIRVERDGGLIVEFHLPYEPGEYPYEFRAAAGEGEKGVWRVVPAEARRSTTGQADAVQPSAAARSAPPSGPTDFRPGSF